MVQKFYHGSPKPIKEGKTIKLRPSSFVLSEKASIRATENIMETARRRVAPDAMSRLSSVFVIDTPDLFAVWRAGGYVAAIHEVEVVGVPERSHNGWWTLVNLHFDEPGFEDMSGRWAEAYWRGEECSVEHPLVQDRKHTPRSFPGSWEYRCKAFKVMSCLGPAKHEAGDVVVQHDGSRMIYISAPECPETEATFGTPTFRKDGVATYCIPDLSNQMERISRTITILKKSVTSDQDGQPEFSH